MTQTETPIQAEETQPTVNEGRPLPDGETEHPVQPDLPFAVVEGQPMSQLPEDLYIPPDALEVFLEAFEGPLDLGPLPQTAPLSWPFNHRLWPGHDTNHTSRRCRRRRLRNPAVTIC